MREWLKGLPENERHAIAQTYYVRILICFHSGSLIALHGFMKKTRVTPREDLELGAKQEGTGEMSRKTMGSSLDDFLKEEGIFEEAQAQAVKEVVARQLARAMKERKISKSRMATLLQTSRSQVDRLLDTRNNVTLSNLRRAAAIVGRRVLIEVV